MANTLNVSVASGRLFDEQGRCNTQPLRCTVTALRPGLQWSLAFSMPTAAKTCVNVLIERADLQEVLEDREDADEIPVFATALLYGDARTELVTDSNGRPVYDSNKASMYRAPIVVSGAFRGARLQPGGVLRIDCAALLPMHIECHLALPK